MEFRERLKMLRKQKNITQSDLAQTLNYGYTAISNYESGRNEPSITDLKKIASFFDVSMDSLLCVNDVKNPYTPKADDTPDEEFLQKYSKLTPERREQYNSLLDWVLSQQEGEKFTSSTTLKAAQITRKYKTKKTK